MAPDHDEIVAELERERALSALAVAALEGTELGDLRRMAEVVVSRQLGGARISPEGNRIVPVRPLTVGETAFGHRVSGVLAQAGRLDLLRHQANHDSLTGLPNRTVLHKVARTTTTAPRPTAVLVCDLDSLKAVNDRHGHRVGDGVLVAVASRIATACRDHDLVTRTGGDEFVVLCPGAGLDEANAVADRIVQSVAQPVRVEDTILQVTLSVGVAIGAPEEPLTEAVDRADAAMYVAKGRRGNSIFRLRTPLPPLRLPPVPGRILQTRGLW